MDDAVDPLKEAQKLLEELKDRRIVVSLNGDKLKVSAPVGKLDDEVKTRLRDRRDAVIARIQELHSHSCPEVIVLPVVEGSPVYLDWLQEVTR